MKSTNEVAWSFWMSFLDYHVIKASGTVFDLHHNSHTLPNQHLLQRDETRGVGGTDTGTTVLDWLAVE